MCYPRSTQMIVLAIILAALQLNFGYAARAQTRPPAKAPATVKTEPVKEKEQDYSQEAFVVEKLLTQYRFEQDGTGQRDVRLRARVQSDAGVQGSGQLVFPYTSANENLEIENVSVHKPDGTVVTASASDVQDLTAPISREAPIYTDLRQKHVTVPGLRPGDVLEYHLVWRLHTPLAPNHFWFDHDFLEKNLIVLDEQLEVNLPLASVVKLKTEKGFEPVIKEQDGRRRYQWKHNSLKREDKDEKEETGKKKRGDEEEPKPPQVQMTTFQSWGEVGAWYANLERERIVPDDKIRAKVAELTRGRTSDQEKIEALYLYVARNFRYVSLSLGQGRYQPHAAKDVFANQYGDCKDKHTLLSAMLIAAGLRAYPAMMNSARKIDADVPSPGQFDHVITAVPLGSELLWMDTTAEVAPFRLISPQLRDKKALLVPANGPAHLETTPAEPPFLSTEVLEVGGQVNDLGKLTGHSHFTLHGDSEMFYRIMFRRTPKSDWKQLGYYIALAGGVRGGEVTELNPSEASALEKPFDLDYDFASDDFLDWSSRKLKIAIPLPALHLSDVDPDKQDAAKPIQLGPPIDVTYRLKLSLPSKYRLRAPVPLNVTRDYAEYSSTYKLEGSTLVAERRFHLRQHELPAARTQDYIAFVAAARADEAQTLSLETDEAGTPAIPESVKTEELLQAAETAERNENYPLSEQLLKRVLAKEPKHKTARRQLAGALFAQLKHDAAIEVLNEQIKINPFDDYSYDLLGQCYWRLNKYDEAAAAFRKQIEVTPLHQSVHGHLGQMLVQWKKFKEAVPELERAIALKSEDEEEDLYVSLGRAYLGSNENDKASEAFEKAIKAAPGARSWNDIAYNLALSNVQLDKAQQYAESAVTAAANDLRNVDLARLTSDDLDNLNSLAAYWDTLGWVQFQKGNIDLAERYLAAAWAIGQYSETGYHLGQIYEKRGQNEEAIRLYALAAVANRLAPEARESLDRLAGKEKSESLLKRAKDDLPNTYTIKLALQLPNLKDNVSADFYVLLVPGTSRRATVASVKFIKGDEKLRAQTALLKTLNYNFEFPDDTSTKVIRRGTMLCQQKNGGCSFILLSPDFVTSVD